jgi:hypothetical protein
MTISLTPIAINYNSIYYGKEYGISFTQAVLPLHLIITPPRNLTSDRFLIGKQKIKLKNNQAKLFLHPTIGNSLDSFYQVKFYQEPQRSGQITKLIKTEYWQVPIYNNDLITNHSSCASPFCFIDNIEQFCCKVKCFKLNQNNLLELKIPHNPLLLQVNLENYLEVMLIQEVNAVKTNEEIVSLERWIFQGDILDLSQNILAPDIKELIIKYYPPLHLKNLIIQTEVCFNNSCNTPSCYNLSI